MKLLHFTDIHLTRPGRLIGGRDPEANFDRALNHALAHHPDAEAIIVTGDLSDLGEADDYRRLTARLASVPVPVELMIGNHDDRATLTDAIPEIAGEGGFVQRVVPLSMGHAILIDTNEPGTHAGRMCSDRLDWLARQLDELPGPLWVFMHHHPVPLGLKALDEIMLLDADRFADTIRPHRDKIAHIFYGHCHLPLSGSLHGIPMSSLRGTNHASFPDFSSDLFTDADLTEAYGVIIATPVSTMVHMVEFGYGGEFRRDA